jgi:hypothetical protein
MDLKTQINSYIAKYNIKIRRCESIFDTIYYHISKYVDESDDESCASAADEPSSAAANTYVLRIEDIDLIDQIIDQNDNDDIPRPHNPLIYDTKSHQLLLAIIIDLESREKLADMVDAIERFFWLPNVLPNAATTVYEMAAKHNLHALLNAPHACDYVPVPETYRDIICGKYIREHADDITTLLYKCAPNVSANADLNIERTMNLIEEYLADDTDDNIKSAILNIYAKFKFNIGTMNFDKLLDNKSPDFIIKFAYDIAHWFRNKTPNNAAYFPIRDLNEYVSLCSRRNKDNDNYDKLKSASHDIYLTLSFKKPMNHTIFVNICGAEFEF